jgi:dolichyl-phosphate-mannose--protein O-mannosyl transferase
MLDLGAGRSKNLWAIGALVVVALTLRTWGLGFPEDLVFDEHYYAFDAYAYLGGTPDLGLPTDPVKIPYEATWEHPPLGKILIAFGEGPLGFGSLGWRLPSAIAGTVGVVVVFLLGLQLFERSGTAAAAAALTSLDGLHIVQSRTAMLDIFATTFITLGVLFAVADLRSGRRAWSTRAGLALGSAIACKWSMLAFVPLVAGLVIVAERRRAEAGRIAVLRLLVALVVAPSAVYLGSYLQFWLAHGPDLRAFATLHARMFQRLHEGNLVGLEDTHFVPPFASRAWRWPLLQSPIRYYPGLDVSAPRREILAFGNPILWWSFVGSAPATLVLWARDRRFDRGIVLGGYACAWLPWFLVGRPTYSYYLVAGVPFMSLALAGLAGDLDRRLRGAVTPLLVLAVAVATAAFLPYWIAAPLAPWREHLRWLDQWR